MNGTRVDRVSTTDVTLGGISLTDLSAGAGAVVWAVAVLVGDLPAIERALALAPLVLVPLGLGMAATPQFDGLAGRFHRWAVICQPVGAGLLLGSLLVTPRSIAAGLATPWVLVTGLFGLAALFRGRERGVWPISETLIDAGLAYATVGSVALVLSHLGVTFWFDPVIVLLTAVHFHYAGFVLPVWAGLAGRCPGVEGDSRYRVLAGVVLVGPTLIALGISFSPLVEFVAVGGFTAAVTALGAYVVLRVAPARPRSQTVLLSMAALALPVSMGLALAYGVKAFTGTTPSGIDIGTMVALHGSLNAFGFGLLGLIGWRLAVPTSTADRHTERITSK